MTAPRAILLVRCPDRPGIVAAISSFLFRHGANITDFDQHTSEDEAAVYFTRLEFQIDRIDLPLDDLEKAFALDVARPFAMDSRLTLSSRRKRVAVLVSRQDSGRGRAATCAPTSPVGATAHYVTAELDAGPIIEQDVGRVTHRDLIEDLKHLGRDLERRVLARAARWHCDDRVIVHGNKTVVFS